ncbi:MAG: hypothetical protein AB1422_07535 [bacterium]
MLKVNIKREKVSKSSEVIIDSKIFKEGDIKETEIWCWKCLKNIKVMIQCKEGKFLVKYIGCSHYS